MVLLFTCGMNTHTPVMYTGPEKSWNGGREAKKHFLRKLVVVLTLTTTVCLGKCYERSPLVVVIYISNLQEHS